ncbi:MAG: phenylalanine--tRNA ligase beta subunit [marine bacterium B5-7]|nr:MAG: phenylalanine--tRNA ligase beta subunit [marine bacterium B5-7]
MKFTTDWLNEWTKTNADAEALSDLLTSLGLEVDSVEKQDKTTIIDIDLTPNRSDCLSLWGVARDVAAATKQTLKPFDVPLIKETSKTQRKTTLKNPDVCPLYASRVIENINPNATTPDWMLTRLEAAGIKIIHPVVDVLNYVMLDVGQPMHAFDLDQLNGDLTVRFAKKDEQLQLLAEQTVTLQADMLVIADDNGPVAAAGVMGGLNSAVSAETKHVLLESAFFQPDAISGRARRLGLHTDGSHRFERGVDPTLAPRALAYATQLLLDIVGGEPGPVTIAESKKHLPTLNTISFQPDRARALLGANIDDARMHCLLEALGMSIEQGKTAWTITPPTWRFDLAIEEDITEEIARLVGYNQITACPPTFTVTETKVQCTQRQLSKWRQHFADVGYTEVISFSFVDPAAQQILMPDEKTLPVVNPIAPELSSMRLSLLPGLLQTLRRNQKRQQNAVRLFERGVCFHFDNDKLQQPMRIAAVVWGEVAPTQWGQAPRVMDFFDMKGQLEQLLAGISNVQFVPSQQTFLHPGQAADVLIDGECLGWVGAVHPASVQALGLKGPVFAFELADFVLCKGGDVQYQPVSKFPAVQRDLAILVDESVSAQSIQDVVDSVVGKWLNKLDIFDVYQGKGLTPGTKSIGLRLTLQEASRTFTDEEIQDKMAALVDKLQQQLQATLREA